MPTTSDTSEPTSEAPRIDRPAKKVAPQKPKRPRHGGAPNDPLADMLTRVRNAPAEPSIERPGPGSPQRRGRRGTRPQRQHLEPYRLRQHVEVSHDVVFVRRLAVEREKAALHMRRAELAAERERGLREAELRRLAEMPMAREEAETEGLPRGFHRPITTNTISQVKLISQPSRFLRRLPSEKLCIGATFAIFNGACLASIGSSSSSGKCTSLA